MPEEPRTERELLRALRTGDEAAFEDAVARWTDLVYAACLRVLGQADAAEDAAQAVFLQLARKAPELSDETVLPAWLYRTAHFIARRAQTAAWRRARHEKEAQKMRPKAATAETAQADAWAEIAPHLDEALDALPAHYREVLVLHFLCGKKQREVAEALRLKESTVSMRVQRGLEKLRAKLLGREAAVSASAFGALLGEHARALAPAHLSGAINAARKNGPASPEVAELANQSLRMAARSSAVSAWALAAAGLLALGLAGWAAWTTWKVPPSKDARAAPRSAASKTDAVPAHADAPAAAPLDVSWTFEHGPPPGLEVLHGAWTWDKARGEMLCEQQTLVRLPVEITRFPVRFEVSYHALANYESVVQCTLQVTDGKILPKGRLWYQGGKIPVSEQPVRDRGYLLGAYRVQTTRGGEAYNVVHIDREPVPGGLVFVGKNCAVREIRLLEVRAGDVPAPFRNPEALLRTQAFKTENIDEVPLPSRPAK